ncbi:hypothetical protein SAMN06296416_101594 [Pseudoxanthomonas wuyuanensis]|uniref:Nuclear transport factor 2 family protein n=2 Tax=Pseudoxanthomonas wuyuanensis TaxID=1073196 RepID=A0A286CYA3_9GAMM|nr:hypothetical protein SAMN06296416_101594 [Pseudoxanthomonas wuyuanensis]
MGSVPAHVGACGLVGVHDRSIPFRMEKAKRLQRLPIAAALNAPGWTGLLKATALLLMLAALAACERATPEQRLCERLDAMQTALSERRPAEFIDGVSEEFSGNGGMDRAAVHNLLRVQLLANRHVGAKLGPAQVEMHGRQATVRFTAVLTGGSGRLLPDSAQVYRVTSGWREEGGQWRIHYAQWEPQL